MLPVTLTPHLLPEAGAPVEIQHHPAGGAVRRALLGTGAGLVAGSEGAGEKAQLGRIEVGAGEEIEMTQLLAFSPTYSPLDKVLVSVVLRFGVAD